MNLTKIGLAAVFATTVTLSSANAGVTDKDILNDQATPGDIVSYGMGPRAQRFSPLKMLNRENIGRLVPAWAFSYGGEKQRGQEAQPLIYDGTIYVAGKIASLGVDCVETELTDLDKKYLKGKLDLYGMEAPNGIDSIVKLTSGKQLWNYDNLEPTEKKLVL